VGAISQARFGLVGSGWRSAFFLRLAQQAPERFAVTGVVTRTADRGAEVEVLWKVPTYRTIPQLLAAERPEFVIPCVPWSQTAQTTIELVEAGVPVLAETPPAADLEGLRTLWTRVGTSGLVQVAEQYLCMPAHAARLALVRRGVIGDVTSVQVSSTHLYHAVSMIRGLLDVGTGPVTVRAQSFAAPLANPLDPDGWTGSAEPEELTTTLAMLDFGTARMGLYDFTDNQWWNPLRQRRIIIRGTMGEIVDDRVIRLVDPYTPVESRLLRRQAGIDLNLEGVDLQHISFDGEVVYRNDFAGARFSEDDLAVADLLAAMAAWCRGDGPAPYPLADGCQDHLVSLAILEASRTGQPVTTSSEGWSQPSSSFAPSAAR
jgi:predicted dehydrogenase